MAYDYYTALTPLKNMESILVFKKRLLNSFLDILNRPSKGNADLSYGARPGWDVRPIAVDNNTGFIPLVGYLTSKLMSLNLHLDDIKKYYVKVPGPGYRKKIKTDAYHLKYTAKYNTMIHNSWVNYYYWRTSGLTARISDIRIFISKLQTIIAQKKATLAREAAVQQEAARVRAIQVQQLAAQAAARKLEARLTAAVAEQQRIATAQAALLAAARAREAARDKEIAATRAREAIRAKEIAAARAREVARSKEIADARAREAALRKEIAATREREAARAKDIAAARAREAALAIDKAKKAEILKSQIDALARAEAAKAAKTIVLAKQAEIVAAGKASLTRAKAAEAVQAGIIARAEEAKAAQTQVAARATIVKEVIIEQKAIADKMKALIAPLEDIVAQAIEARDVQLPMIEEALEDIKAEELRVAADPHLQKIAKMFNAKMDTLRAELLEKAKELSPEEEKIVIAKAKKGIGTGGMLAIIGAGGLALYTMAT